MPAVHCVVFVDKILTLPLRMLSSLIVPFLGEVQLFGRHFSSKQLPFLLVLMSVKIRIGKLVSSMSKMTKIVITQLMNTP